jgi:hypothetical protein
MKRTVCYPITVLEGKNLEVEDQLHKKQEADVNEMKEYIKKYCEQVEEIVDIEDLVQTHLPRWTHADEVREDDTEVLIHRKGCRKRHTTNDPLHKKRSVKDRTNKNKVFDSTRGYPGEGPEHRCIHNHTFQCKQEEVKTWSGSSTVCVCFKITDISTQTTHFYCTPCQEQDWRAHNEQKQFDSTKGYPGEGPDLHHPHSTFIRSAYKMKEKLSRIEVCEEDDCHIPGHYHTQAKKGGQAATGYEKRKFQQLQKRQKEKDGKREDGQMAILCETQIFGSECDGRHGHVDMPDNEVRKLCRQYRSYCKAHPYHEKHTFVPERKEEVYSESEKESPDPDEKVNSMGEESDEEEQDEDDDFPGFHGTDDPPAAPKVEKKAPKKEQKKWQPKIRADTPEPKAAPKKQKKPKDVALPKPTVPKHLRVVVVDETPKGFSASADNTESAPLTMNEYKKNEGIADAQMKVVYHAQEAINAGASFSEFIRAISPHEVKERDGMLYLGPRVSKYGALAQIWSRMQGPLLDTEAEWLQRDLENAEYVEIMRVVQDEIDKRVKEKPWGDRIDEPLELGPTEDLSIAVAQITYAEECAAWIIGHNTTIYSVDKSFIDVGHMSHRTGAILKHIQSLKEGRAVLVFPIESEETLLSEGAIQDPLDHQVLKDVNKSFSSYFAQAFRGRLTQRTQAQVNSWANSMETSVKNFLKQCNYTKKYDGVVYTKIMETVKRDVKLASMTSVDKSNSIQPLLRGRVIQAIAALKTTQGDSVWEICVAVCPKVMANTVNSLVNYFVLWYATTAQSAKQEQDFQMWDVLVTALRSIPFIAGGSLLAL